MSENENEVKMKVKMKNSIYKSGIYKIYNERKKKQVKYYFYITQNWIKKVSSWKKQLKALLPVFFVLLTNVRYTWHRIHHRGSFPPEFRIRNSGSGIPEQFNLALE